MSHLSTKCDCDRPIHFPKDAQIGYVWKCHTPNCGREWILTNQGGGKPLYETRSKRPPKEEYQNRPSHSNNSGSGCIVVGIVLFFSIAGSTYKVIEFLLT